MHDISHSLSYFLVIFKRSITLPAAQYSIINQSYESLKYEPKYLTIKLFWHSFNIIISCLRESISPLEWIILTATSSPVGLCNAL